MEEGTRFQVLAPVVRERKGEYVDLFSSLQTQGFSRVRVDGVVHPLTEPPKLKKQEKHTIEVIVDRLTVKESAKRRLTDSVETALGLAGGLVVLDFVDLDEHDPHRERTFSEHLACVDDGLSFEALEPRSFSFNSPFGACPECTGIGTRKEVDPDLVIPDPEKSLAQGAVAPWASSMTNEYFLRLLTGLGQQLGFSMDTPWERLPAKAQKAVLHGSPDQVHVRYKNRYGRERSYYAAFEGVHAVPRAPARGHRQRLRAGQVRGLHARRALSRLPRHPAQAGDPRGQAQRPLDRRGHQPLDRRRLRVAERPGAGRSGSGPSPTACSRRSRRGCRSWSTSASTTSRSTGRPRRSPAVRRSASGWPPRSAPAWSASSTCSTSRRSGCTSGTTPG